MCCSNKLSSHVSAAEHSRALLPPPVPCLLRAQLRSDSGAEARAERGCSAPCAEEEGNQRLTWSLVSAFPDELVLPFKLCSWPHLQGTRERNEQTEDVVSSTLQMW